MFNLDYDLCSKTGSIQLQTDEGPREANYLPWALIYGLAGRPEQHVVTFDGRMFTSFLGGAVVAVEQVVSGPQGDTLQRVYLPIQDSTYKAVSVDRLDVRKVSDAIQRCRAKAVACVSGVGLDIHMGYGGCGKAFAGDLGITPETDLSTMGTLVSEKVNKKNKSKRDYLHWATALAAARITDPGFVWSVEHCDVIDTATGEVRSVPYTATAGGFMVGVRVSYKGRQLVEWLPIMGIQTVQTKNGPKPMEHQPLANPDVNDWNRGVMRCLAKAIAVRTGYGLSLYAKDDLAATIAAQDGLASSHSVGQPLATGSASAVGAERESSGAADDAGEGVSPAHLLAEVKSLVAKCGRDPAKFAFWLGVPSLDAAPVPELKRAKVALLDAMNRTSTAA